MLISENRWLAQRYGTEKGLVDFGTGELVPYPELIEEILGLIREDAEHFDCEREVEHARAILQTGTSSHSQLRSYDEAKAAGASDAEALRAVVDMLVRETLQGV